MTEALIDEFSRVGHNLIVEGTLRTAEVPLKTATLLRSHGYRVSLALMAVKPEISLVSCQIRYELCMRIAGTIPRAVDPKHHDRIVRDIVSNLSALEQSGLFDEVRLFSRTREMLVSSGRRRPDGGPGLARDPVWLLDQRGNGSSRSPGRIGPPASRTAKQPDMITWRDILTNPSSSSQGAPWEARNDSARARAVPPTSWRSSATRTMLAPREKRARRGAGAAARIRAAQKGMRVEKALFRPRRRRRGHPLLRRPWNDRAAMLSLPLLRRLAPHLEARMRAGCQSAATAKEAA